MHHTPHSIAAALLLAALALTACSSGSGHAAAPSTSASTTPAPSTTIPPPPPAPTAAVQAATRTFLAGTGARLLQFERITAPMSTGRQPTLTQCQAILKELPKLIKGPNEFQALALRTPDNYLGRLIETDGQIKNLALKVCGTKNGLQIPKATLPILVLYRNRITARLADSGIKR